MTRLTLQLARIDVIVLNSIAGLHHFDILQSWDRLQELELIFSGKSDRDTVRVDEICVDEDDFESGLAFQSERNHSTRPNRNLRVRARPYDSACLRISIPLTRYLGNSEGLRREEEKTHSAVVISWKEFRRFLTFYSLTNVHRFVYVCLDDFVRLDVSCCLEALNLIILITINVQYGQWSRKGGFVVAVDVPRC